MRNVLSILKSMNKLFPVLIVTCTKRSNSFGFYVNIFSICEKASVDFGPDPIMNLMILP
jgi:hypothetical protein